MQRYKALLEKTKTLFWNRWFTTNRRVDGRTANVCCRVVGFSCGLHKGHGRVRSGPPITQVIPGQSTGYGRASWQGGLHNRMSIALKDPHKPGNGPKTPKTAIPHYLIPV